MFSPSTMLPDHPRWAEFLERLSRVDRCALTTEHSRAILESMDGIDAPESLRALGAIGGYCDCSILYDLDRDASYATARSR